MRYPPFAPTLEWMSSNFSIILNKVTCVFTCQQARVWLSLRVFFFSLQLQWLNKYYETIQRLVGPELDKQGLHEEKTWMLKNTEPLVAPGSSASVCSSSLTLVALAVAFLHNIVWASSSPLYSLHSQQTCTPMLPLCSLYWAAIPGWEMNCNLAFF